jgi:Na+/H+-translocating membrane pyrophosphatase
MSAPFGLDACFARALSFRAGFNSGRIHQPGFSMTTLWLIVLCGVLALLYAIWATFSVMRADPGSAKMQEISAAVREGAQAYLRRQYTTIAIVGIVIFLIVGYLLGWLVAVGFAVGAILSGSAGFIGMNVSVRANVRTAQAAIGSLAGGLELAFRAGAITGLLVAGLALLGVTLYFGFLTGTLHFAPNDRVVVDSMVALGFGASLISTIHAIRPPSPTTSATMSATAPAWRPTCSRPMPLPLSRPWFWPPSSSVRSQRTW